MLETEPRVAPRTGATLCMEVLQCCRRNLAFPCAGGHALHGGLECCRRNLAFPLRGGQMLHRWLECSVDGTLRFLARAATLKTFAWGAWVL